MSASMLKQKHPGYMPSHQHCVESTHPPFILTRFTFYHSIFALRDPAGHGDASCTHKDHVYPISHSRKSINNRFLFFLSIILFGDSFPLSSPLSLNPHPSLFAFCFLLVKWSCQVPRYVSDAAPHIPTFRFGKEMSTKSRLQGRPFFCSTFLPVLHKYTPLSLLYSIILFHHFVCYSSFIQFFVGEPHVYCV